MGLTYTAIRVKIRFKVGRERERGKGE